jgi:predicted RNase H-like nuclease
VTNRALSKQAFAILPKIREVDSVMTPELQQRVREMHPEVAFCVLNGGPLVHRKKTQQGQQERLEILARYGVVLDPYRERGRLGASRVGVDDLIDAAVGLVTALRIQSNRANVLGGTLDAKGLRMEIVS